MANKKISFYVFNIKLQTEKAADERKKEYIRIIRELSKRKSFFQIGKNEAITMYTAYGDSSNPEPPYIYGHAARGTYIAGDEITILKDGKITKGLNDPNQLIDPKTVDYIFVPEVHRFALQKVNGGPSHVHFEKYLNSFLSRIKDKDDILEIVLEKDSDVIQEIFTAKAIHSLSYKISYTNDDLMEDYGNELDEQLKQAKIGEISVVAKADNQIEGFDINESVILKGGLELAKSNGEIRNAVIVPAGKSIKKKKISNSNLPQVQVFEDDDQGSKWKRWAKAILSLYQN